MFSVRLSVGLSVSLYVSLYVVVQLFGYEAIQSMLKEWSFEQLCL